MANTIRIKRRASGASGAPASLQNAELAFNEVDDVLYYGKGSGGVGGTATTVEAIGGKGAYVGVTGNQSVSGEKTFSGILDVTGTLKIGGTTVTADASEINKLDGVTAGTASAGKVLIVDANKDLNLNGGDLTATDVVVTGNLTVQGTTTTVDSTTVNVADKNITLGNVGTPSDTTADGGGITLKGATDKTLNWIDSTDSWTSSEHINLASGKEFKINGSSVLSGSALGSGVTSSSLTSVGTIATGTWQGSAVGIQYGGTGQTSAQSAINALTAVSSATNEYVLTKDTATGNAVFKAAANAAITSDPEITALASVTSAADALPYFTGAGTATTTTLSSFGRSLIDDADSSAARGTLGLAIGTDVQAYDADLAALAGVTSAADKLPYFTGSATAAVTTLTSFGRSLIDDVDASAARTTLGLAIGTDVQAYDAELAALAGLSSAADKLPYFTGSGAASLATFTSFGRSLVDDVDASAARTTLGLAIGTDVQAYDAELAALASVTSASDALPYFSGSGTATTTTLSSFGRSLIDDADSSAARTTLGLGSMATQASNNVSITGGSIDNITFDGGTF
jgi:hypothetical protein